MKNVTLLLAVGLSLVVMGFNGTHKVEASILVVTSDSDSGPGTLRQALLEAVNGDTITFDPVVFPPGSPVTITLTSGPLPTIKQGDLTIDASKSGVILDGSELAEGDGLLIESDGNVVKGLQILYFPDNGILIHNGSSKNMIGGSNFSPGGTCSSECNLISNNGNDGVMIQGAGTMSNTISGNYIGTDVNGMAALGNNYRGVFIRDGAHHNSVINNVISGNGNDGVPIEGRGTIYNTVSGNYIGTNSSGVSAIGNTLDGVHIYSDAQYNTVINNVISGNNQNGVQIRTNDTMYNTISGNYIGTDAAGKTAVPNGRGISIYEWAHHNLVGGDTPDERNIISGNAREGVVIYNSSNNIIRGNYIGTDVTGTSALRNGYEGITITDGGFNNTIGGRNATPGEVCSGECNLISGNGREGVWIGHTGTISNTISGNYIGTDVGGEFIIGNERSGIHIDPGGSNNVIGGDTPSERNLISGNENGISIRGNEAMNNTISGNFIGTDVTGTRSLGNAEHGVGMWSGPNNNTVGGSIYNEGNIISGNMGDGVYISGNDTLNNTISHNSIYGNGGMGIQNLEGGNNELSAPKITDVSSRLIKGTAIPNVSVEIFSDDEDEGRVFEGSTISSQNGDFIFQMPAGRFTGPYVTTTATDNNGNTSQFSPQKSPPSSKVTKELPDIIAPTQVSIEPKVVGTNLGLALFSVLFFGFTATFFNSIVEDYRDEIVGTFGNIVPRPIVYSINRISLLFRRTSGRTWHRLIFMWFIVLLITAIIESFLDPDIGIVSTERMGIIITLFISAIVVSALELSSNLLARRHLAPNTKAETKVQWIGIAIAVACVLLSRALDFKPGYLYGIVGAIYLTPKLIDTISSGKRAVFVLMTIFVGGLLVWIASVFLPDSLTELEPVFLTVFLLCLQMAFFELFPLAVTEGCDIWSWRRGVWFVLFLVVFFCFYHFLLNPNASEVQALQQNGVQTLIIFIAVFGLATFTLWLLFPFRLQRKSVGE